jgi:hypothetical protein
MGKSFITIGGKEYRVEVNWNALSNFLKAVGRDTLEGLSNISSLHPSDLAPLMAAAINEGERLEGRESNLTGESLGEIIRPSHVGQFMDIYIQQSRAQVEVEAPAKKKENQEE